MSSDERRLVIALAAATVAGVAVRLYAATRIGFGDAEALYASYALHPAPAYLDHPGLVALFARLLGDGAAPDPVAAHRATAVLASAAPWATVWAARALRAPWKRALAAGLVTAAVPELALGLFGMTPDVLLFFLWTASVGLAGAGLLAPPSSLRASAFLLLAGLAAGAGVAAKVSALGLVAALVLTYASKPARQHARTPWPWLGLALGGVVVTPVVAYEARSGWPMLHHRLIATQAEAGLSLRNAAALVGGQLVYLSPVLAVLAVLAGRSLAERWIQERRVPQAESAVTVLLTNAAALPLALLLPLCLWSKVAEPHWIAPALLALPLAYACHGLDVPAWAARAGVATAAAMSVAAHAWVLLPGLASLVPEGRYDARLDISNELYGWSDVAGVTRELARRHVPPSSEPGEMVLVGPHWVICAQLAAALGASFPVGCSGHEAADFAAWNPRARWEHADLVLFVTDQRFPSSTAQLFPDRARIEKRIVELRRGGHVARTFTLELLSLRDVS